MAKILVADDNSNVQKTVALALADLGVEVVAVNNGDAAVRKLGDVNPDLVLADIFMPVRNGYEVCDYVKKDSRFAHVPVVLLVGAFDPLDEREAQRVGADGILKKPFVPPDPLIAMVKTLLDRALNEKLVAVGANAKPAAAAQTSAAGSTGAVKVEERPAPPPAQAAVPEIPELSPEPVAEEELHPPVDRMPFGEGNAPVAFGQLLDPPVAEATETETEAQAIEPVEDDQVLTSARDANLGEPAFWNAEEAEAEAEEGEGEAEEEDGSHDFSRSWGLGEDALATHESGEAERAPGPLEAEATEPLELVRDDHASTDTSASIVEHSAPFAQDPASQASLHVRAGRAEDLAANPLDWMATAPQQTEDEEPVEKETGGSWTAEEVETSEGEDSIAEAAEAETTEAEPEPIEEMQLEPQSFELPEPPAPPLPAPPPAASPIGVMAPPSFLGTSIPGSKPPVAPPAASTSSQAKSAAPASDPDKTVPPFKRIDQSADDTAQSIPLQQWADLTAGLERPAAPPAQNLKPAAPSFSAPSSPAPPPQAARTNSSPASPTAGTDSAAPDPALVEAVVQRVLDKMRPQVVDIITKEFLRPVVQALVHREINREPTKH